MASKKNSKIPIVNKYKTTITYTCPVRGVVIEEIEVPVYAARSEITTLELIDLDKLRSEED